MQALRRPCCGAKVALALLFEGRVYFPHKTTCDYYRKRQ